MCPQLSCWQRGGGSQEKCYLPPAWPMIELSKLIGAQVLSKRILTRCLQGFTATARGNRLRRGVLQATERASTDGCLQDGGGKGSPRMLPPGETPELKEFLLMTSGCALQPQAPRVTYLIKGQCISWPDSDVFCATQEEETARLCRWKAWKNPIVFSFDISMILSASRLDLLNSHPQILNKQRGQARAKMHSFQVREHCLDLVWISVVS